MASEAWTGRSSSSQKSCREEGLELLPRMDTKLTEPIKGQHTLFLTPDQLDAM